MKTQVLIIGGGITGTGLARDLALRGVQCVLVEKEDINAGASGGNHGLLHSGARYVSNDPASATECRSEGEILKKLAPHCIEDTGGLYVAVEGDDENYAADFPGMCSRSDIPVSSLDTAEARALEPALSEKLIAAYLVEDASVDPFKLSLENLWQAQDLGTEYLPGTKAIGFERAGSRIVSVRLVDTDTGGERTIEVEHVVNAAGAWAGEVAAMAGASISMLYSKGTLLITHSRITKHVINRLRPPSDADILVPGGVVSILGTTSVRTDALDNLYPTVDEADHIVEEGAAMIPSLESTRYIRAYCGVRPLIGSETVKDGRAVSRDFSLLDHEEEGLENFATITGGKLTTYRLMAEKTADLVCRRLGVFSPCLTRTEPLPCADACRWTESGMAPRQWITRHDPGDHLLCECEMVPESTIDAIIASLKERAAEPDLRAIGLRSRAGKGPCQGAYCSFKIAAHMIEAGEMRPDAIIANIKGFLSGRWRGQHAVLWGEQLAQAELAEALHCGVFGLELHGHTKKEDSP